MGDQQKHLMAECFDLIRAFNDLAGNLGTGVKYNLEADMLAEEVKEYRDAAHAGDQKEVKDALGDIMFVLGGTILKHKLDGEFWDILQEICRSNMTKFPITPDEAMKTVEYWNTQGIITTATFNEQHKVWVVKDSNGKVKKSINFKPPQL